MRPRRKGRTGKEVSNWWFSDEELQEAVSNIVDTPEPRRPRKLVTREPRETKKQEKQEVTYNGNKD